MSSMKTNRKSTEMLTKMGENERELVVLAQDIDSDDGVFCLNY